MWDRLEVTGYFFLDSILPPLSCPGAHLKQSDFSSALLISGFHSSNCLPPPYLVPPPPVSTLPSNGRFPLQSLLLCGEDLLEAGRQRKMVTQFKQTGSYSLGSRVA